MSDPSLDALAAAAAVHLAALDAPECPRWECMRHPCDVCVARRAARDTLNERAPDLARGYVAAVDALRSVRSELDVLRANRGTADRLLGAWATIAHAYRVDPSVANAERLAVLTTSAAEVRDAAIARATAAEAQRAALAAAVREERDAADAYDAACAALDSDACAVASVRMDAATTATDALLSGCAADVVRAGVVRAYLDAVAAWEAARSAPCDAAMTVDQVRARVAAVSAAVDVVRERKAALDAALAAATGR